MVEQFDFTKIDTMSLADLERLLTNMDMTKDPFGIAVMRRYLMRQAQSKTDQSIIEQIVEQIQEPSTELMKKIIKNPTPFKFVREGKNMIIFQDLREDADNGIMHIQYALAAGMYLPDDGGFLGYYPNREAFQLSGNSSSLHIPPYNNPARQVSLKILRPSIPAQFTLTAS